VNTNPLKEKQFHKGLNQLAEEGVVQIFSKPNRPNVRVLGVVGQLQLEVLQYRLEHEYGASCRYEGVEYTMAHWIDSDDPKVLETFVEENARRILLDIRDTYIFMSESSWNFEYIKKNNPKIRFYTTSEMVEHRA
jgi:peptide chain release factor 3